MVEVGGEESGMKDIYMEWVNDRMSETDLCDGWQARSPQEPCQCYGPIFQTEDELHDHLWEQAEFAFSFQRALRA